MKKVLPLLLVFSSLFLSNCKKEEQEQTLFWFYYVETRCSNPFDIEAAPETTMQIFFS